MRDDNRSEMIHDAIGFLDDELLEDVDALRNGAMPPKQENEARPIVLRRRWVAIAASICLIIVVGSLWNNAIGSNNVLNMESSDEREPSGNVQEDVLQENTPYDDNVFDEEGMKDCEIEKQPTSTEADKEEVEGTEDTEEDDTEDTQTQE